MGLATDLSNEVAKIHRDSWTERDGNKVPESEDLKLGNDAVWLEAVILYADMADSTDLVDTFPAKFAAEIYKTFLHCAAKIIKFNGGTITAYDGDRIMAVFIGNSKNTSAVKSALMINWTRIKILTPALKKQYPDNTYTPKHVVGIDSCKILVARTGVRGANDLVWVGRAANHAAKFSGFNSSHPTWISSEVYDSMHQEVKFSSKNEPMWTESFWEKKNRKVYCSTWMWAVPDA